MSVIVDAFAGQLHGPQSLAVVAQLMAADGLKAGSAARSHAAFALLEDLVRGQYLETVTVSVSAPVHGRWRRFVQWDRRDHGPRDGLVQHEGRAGFWQEWESLSGPQEHQPGDMQVMKTVTTKLIAPEALGALLKGKLGGVVKAKGFVTPELSGWLEAAAEHGSEPLTRTQVAERFHFLRKDGKPGKDSYGDIGELMRKRKGGALLVTVERGMLRPEDAQKAAAQKGWAMEEKEPMARVGAGGTLVRERPSPFPVPK